jgi:hypothetical protein
MHSQNVPAKAKLLNLHSKALKWAFEIIAVDSGAETGSDGLQPRPLRCSRDADRHLPPVVDVLAMILTRMSTPPGAERS